MTQDVVHVSENLINCLIPNYFTNHAWKWDAFMFNNKSESFA